MQTISRLSFLRRVAGVLALLAFAVAAPAADKPNVVLISGEFEYSSMITLPALKNLLEQRYDLNCVYLQRTGGEDIPGLEALERADLAIFYIRRMTLPEAQLRRIQRYVRSGKPLVALRTSSHAFENWKEFDREVLGGNYQGHHGNALVATARIHPEAAAHPILRGVATEFITGGSLYKTVPLAAAAKPLLIGSVSNQSPEPMAWTHEYQGARIFYSSLGDPKDFTHQPFMQMLVNAIFWSLDRPVPEADRPAPAIASFPVKKVDLSQFEKLAAHRKFTVLDVRTEREFTGGHVARAVNLDFNSRDFAQQAAALDRNAPYAILCEVGGRSAKAAQKMHELGFPFLYDFTGSMREWRKANKPVVK